MKINKPILFIGIIGLFFGYYCFTGSINSFTIAQFWIQIVLGMFIIIQGAFMCVFSIDNEEERK